MGFLVGLVVFFKLALKKVKSICFLAGSNYINPEDNHRRLIHFLSQISKLFYFNMHDFMMHYHKVSHFIFVLIQLHTCVCNMRFILSFFINWQFRQINHIGSHKPVSVLSFSNFTFNSHITGNENFLTYFVRIISSYVVYKFQTVIPGCPTSPLHTS